MTEFAIAIRRELDGLEAELRADPRHEKIRHLRELLALYEAAGHAQKITPEPKRAFRPKPTAGAATKAAAMLQAITELLQARVQVHRQNILEHLQERGIMGGEKRPMGHLAAFLSDHRDLFMPDGKGNFRLRSAPTAPPGNGLFENDTGRSAEEPAGYEFRGEVSG